MTALKPCPFCGCKPKVGSEPTRTCYFVHCAAHRCMAFAETHRYNTRAEAIAAWNRRAK